MVEETLTKDAIGFWRKKGNGQPVAVWTGKDGQIYGRVGEGTTTVINDRWVEIHVAACEKVSAEDYWRVIEGDGQWPDYAPIGHNKPPEGIDALLAELADLLTAESDLRRSGEAKTKVEADTAANLANRIKELRKLIEEHQTLECEPVMREIARLEAEKRPFLAKAEEVRQQYAPHLTKADEAVQRLRGFVAPFLIKAKEAARKAAEAAGMVGARITTNAGAKGSKTFLSTVWSATITDYDKALLALKDHADVKAVVQKLANSAARSKAKTPIPGVEFISREEIR